ncbi:hypothetical protein HPB50_004532 [Hyalomma asiaticum]|uniref:Uncharacterized protein n=1 Tax=Hyalomma asiaticum TaxID=266040 RepID=A0ACB7RXS9_HYAAI|nr:hypothetical protein HPB50_004532 [Hyalomma asiaticum]
MAAPRQQYTLVGFSEELDWRPLHFVEPIPANRVCSSCGLVPRSAAVLSCRHMLCKTCYDQCLVEDKRACPLDVDTYPYVILIKP